MGQFHFTPERYLDLMRAEVPSYERLQSLAVEACGSSAARILELGVGTGETSRRLLERFPSASLVGIDASANMLAAARSAVPHATLRVGRLEEALPSGPFDLVVSVLAVHHLDGAGKADLFRRVAAALDRGGRFVMGDVVVPEDTADVVTPIDGVYDRPSTVADQLEWLASAGFSAVVTWSHRDLAVISANVNPAG
jgi:tRNA (cmo5U34)-methyltransferase